MFLCIIYIVVGIALVLWGADRMTEGAAAIARRMRVPEMVIGLTIVAAGTSAPELFVSLVSALKGTPDLAVGNVVGSNIFNTLLIVGCAAMVAPMSIMRSTVTKDMPFTMGATVLLVLLCLDSFTSPDIRGNMISCIDGIILIVGFAAFMAYTLRTARKGVAADGGKDSVADTFAADEASAEDVKVWKGLLFLGMGLAGLIVGSNIFVDAASSAAMQLGVSESVTGLTIVAGGTSLPELATSVVAARKGRSAIAIGNVIGSNVFNILAILGITASICPMRIGGITIVDLSVMFASVAVLWLFSFTKYTVARWEGAVLTAGFAGYMYWLLSNI